MHHNNFRKNYSETIEDYFQSIIAEGIFPSPQKTDKQKQTIPQEETHHKAQSESSEKGKIIQKDLRKQVKEILYPYSSIGLMQMKFGQQSYTGTGFLIGSDLVLTCAHNCYNNFLGQASDLIFQFAFNGSPSQKYRVDKIYYPTEYEKEEDDIYDLALLKLERSTNNKYGTLGIDFSAQSQAGQAFLYGYPETVRVNGEKKNVKGKMYGMKGVWIRDQSSIRYDMIPSSHGQSGSPIFIQKDQKYYAIGVHTNGGLGYSYGLSLNNRVRIMINKWIRKTQGKLILNRMGLKDCDMEILANENFPNITHLDVQKNHITATGVQIICKKFEKLESLSLSINEIKDLPQEIWKLEFLKELNISNIQLTKLPQSISCLKNLQKLRVCTNKLNYLPQSIKSLTLLRQLSIYENELTQLPQISSLINLQELWMHRNNLTHLSSSIGVLKSLRKLGASGNQFSKLPKQIGQLINLKKLGLSGNKLSQLPQSIGKLSNLKFLTVSGNQLTQLPQSIGQLSNLNQLVLSGNLLTQLPQSIGQLVNLQKLELSNNKLIYLPESMTNLASLKQLFIHNNKLKTLPEQFGKLIKLVTFGVTGNDLSYLPQSIGELNNLRGLGLNDNELVKLPFSLCKLPNLLRLEVSNNKLTSLPQQITNLEKLTIFNCQNNPLQKLSASVKKLMQKFKQ